MMHHYPPMQNKELSQRPLCGRLARMTGYEALCFWLSSILVFPLRFFHRFFTKTSTNNQKAMPRYILNCETNSDFQPAFMKALIPHVGL